MFIIMILVTMMMIMMIMTKAPITRIQPMFPFTPTHINAKMSCMPVERPVVIIFAILHAADYLPIRIAIIMDVRLSGGIGIGATVIFGRIIGPTL
ncbi:hypothetical protein BDV37DRAFT_265684 [Aspergillus pseudonomiae]|uniref:Uncharacterized protein n=1 Tax=Aspergillus pseudonomiae TaxID=1506151 RepID=A0A5N7CTV4_9EURO|nr:uncharacterized protein BDV37DRAFT_265684 [Aspergillus pseudonomiae]KAE8397409.1 hypothetical protein BDV37DRAFT_265684 [Aspergillus pseudonomiae]